MDDNKVPKIPNTGGNFDPGSDWIGPIPAPQTQVPQIPKVPTYPPVQPIPQRPVPPPAMPGDTIYPPAQSIFRPTSKPPIPKPPVAPVEVYPISKIPIPLNEGVANIPNSQKPLQVDFLVPQKPLETNSPITQPASHPLNVDFPVPKNPIQTNISAQPINNVPPVIKTNTLSNVPLEKTAPANPPTKNIFFAQPTGPAELDKDQFMPVNKINKDQFMSGGRMGWPTPPADKDVDKSLTADAPQPPTSIKNIRTFESDVADVLAHKRTSVTTMAIAANRKQSGGSDVIKSFDAEPASHQGLKILIGIISLLFIGGGAVGAYYLYSRSILSQTQTTITQQTDQRPARLVPIDSQKIIAIDGLDPSEIQAQIKAELAKTQPPNSIKEVILTHTKGGVVTQVSAQEIIGVLKINMPDTLRRSLTPAWMLGIYADNNGQTSYFVIMTNNFFQNAFAGMLAWESIMADDIRVYIYDPSIRGVSNKPGEKASQPITPVVITPPAVTLPVVATSTISKTTSKSKIATTTPVSTSTEAIFPETTLAPYPTLHGQFYDKILQNTDVREFKTTDGRMAFLYTFIDNSRLLMAGNEDVVVEIVKRLENASYMR